MFITFSILFGNLHNCTNGKICKSFKGQFSFSKNVLHFLYLMIIYSCHCSFAPHKWSLDDVAILIIHQSFLAAHLPSFIMQIVMQCIQKQELSNEIPKRWKIRTGFLFCISIKVNKIIPKWASTFQIVITFLKECMPFSFFFLNLARDVYSYFTTKSIKQNLKLAIYKF